MPSIQSGSLVLRTALFQKGEDMKTFFVFHGESQFFVKWLNGRTAKRMRACKDFLFVASVISHAWDRECFACKSCWDKRDAGEKSNVKPKTGKKYPSFTFAHDVFRIKSVCKSKKVFLSPGFIPYFVLFYSLSGFYFHLISACVVLFVNFFETSNLYMLKIEQYFVCLLRIKKMLL